MFKNLSRSRSQQPGFIDVNSRIERINSYIKNETDFARQAELSLFLSELTKATLRAGIYKLYDPVLGDYARFYQSNPHEKLLGGFGICDVCCFMCCSRPIRVEPTSRSLTPLETEIKQALVSDNVVALSGIGSRVGTELLARFPIGDRRDTPLHFAKSDLMVGYLCDIGANVNGRNGKGQTPLHTASTGAVVRALVARGGDVNARLEIAMAEQVRVDEWYVHYFPGQTPLHCAESPDVVTALLDLGARVDLKNDPVTTTLVVYDKNTSMIMGNPSHVIEGFTAFESLHSKVASNNSILIMRPILVRAFNMLDDENKNRIRQINYDSFGAQLVDIPGALPASQASDVLKPPKINPFVLLEYIKYLKQDIGASFTDQLVQNFDNELKKKGALPISGPNQTIREGLLLLVK